MIDYRITNIKMILKKKKIGFFLFERVVVFDIFWYEIVDIKIVRSSCYKYLVDWGFCFDWFVYS